MFKNDSTVAVVQCQYPKCAFLNNKSLKKAETTALGKGERARIVQKGNKLIDNLLCGGKMFSIYKKGSVGKRCWKL